MKVNQTTVFHVFWSERLCCASTYARCIGRQIQFCTVFQVLQYLSTFLSVNSIHLSYSKWMRRGRGCINDGIFNYKVSSNHQKKYFRVFQNIKHYNQPFVTPDLEKDWCFSWPGSFFLITSIYLQFFLVS